MKIFEFRREKPKPNEFSLRGIHQNDRAANQYFFRYRRPDGQWVEVGDPICDVCGDNISESYIRKTFFAERSGVLEWIHEEGNILEEGITLYRLHEKGEYEKENSVLNYEYIHYFESLEDEFSFVEWFIADGDKVQKDDRIYMFESSIGNIWVSTAEKSGYIDLASVPLKEDDVFF